MIAEKYLSTMDCSTQEKILASYDHIRDTYSAEDVATACGCTIDTADRWLGPFQSIQDVLDFVQDMKKRSKRRQEMSTVTELQADILKQIMDERRNQGGTEETDRDYTTNDWVAFITCHLGQSLCCDQGELRFEENMIKVAALAVIALEAYKKGGKK